jgi:hypothetical protein
VVLGLVTVQGLDDAVEVEASNLTHTCALLVGARLECWGSGDGLGIGGNDTDGLPRPVEVPPS